MKCKTVNTCSPGFENPNRALHTASAPEIWIDQSRFRRREKTLLSLSQCLGIEIGHLLSLEMALNTHRKGFKIPKTLSDYKKRKI